MIVKASLPRGLQPWNWSTHARLLFPVLSGLHPFLYLAPQSCRVEKEAALSRVLLWIIWEYYPPSFTGALPRRIEYEPIQLRDRSVPGISPPQPRPRYLWHLGRGGRCYCHRDCLARHLDFSGYRPGDVHIQERLVHLWSEQVWSSLNIWSSLVFDDFLHVTLLITVCF